MFDRKSQFDRSFFDRTFSLGPGLPARIPGTFSVVTRTFERFTTVTRPSMFTVVAKK